MAVILDRVYMVMESSIRSGFWESTVLFQALTIVHYSKPLKSKDCTVGEAVTTLTCINLLTFAHSVVTFCSGVGLRQLCTGSSAAVLEGLGCNRTRKSDNSTVRC